MALWRTGTSPHQTSAAGGDRCCTGPRFRTHRRTAGSPYRGLRWVFIGRQGLRAGWSVLIFVAIFIILNYRHRYRSVQGAPGEQEGDVRAPVGFPCGVGQLLGHARRGGRGGSDRTPRRILDYNLTGPRRRRHFFFGPGGRLSGAFGADRSAGWGGWLHFGPVGAFRRCDLPLWRAVGLCVSAGGLR